MAPPGCQLNCATELGRTAETLSAAPPADQAQKPPSTMSVEPLT